MKNLPVCLIFLSILCLLGACVPNRKYLYLQKDDVNKRSMPEDSVMRSYQTKSFDYKIQANDLLSIRFESLTPEEYNFFSVGRETGGGGMNATAIMLNGDLVDEQGNVPFPFVGKVKVSGLTVFQAQDTLQKLATRYLENPVVKVRLLNFRFTILGEVRSQNTYTTQNNRITIVEAISLAGGLGDQADRANIKIVRQKQETAEIAYVNLLQEDVIQSPYYFVNQNDVIIVPPLRQRPFKTYFGQNLGLFVSTLSLVLLVYNLTQN